MTRRTSYQFIVRYNPEAFSGVPRDHALAALHKERIRCYGQFYRPIPDDPLFASDPHTNPATRAGADYTGQKFPVAAKAAYEESIWMPHELFLGDEGDVNDLLTGFQKLASNATALRERPPAAPGGRR